MIEIKVTRVATNKQVAASRFQAVLLLAGIVSFSYGAYLAWRPLGFIVGGVLVFGIGILMNKISEKESK